VFASQLTPITQESVLAYEAGNSGLSTLNRAVQLSGAGFYYDYKKTSRSWATGPSRPSAICRRCRTFPNRAVRGAELQATVVPFTGLHLTGGASYIDSRVNGSVIAPKPPSVRPIDLNGRGLFRTRPSGSSWGDGRI